MPGKVWDEIIDPFLNFNGSTVPYLIIDVITYPCWDQNQTMLVKGAPDIRIVSSEETPELSDPIMQRPPPVFPHMLEASFIISSEIPIVMCQK